MADTLGVRQPAAQTEAPGGGVRVLSARLGVGGEVGGGVPIRSGLQESLWPDSPSTGRTGGGARKCDRGASTLSPSDRARPGGPQSSARQPDFSAVASKRF